MRERSNILNVVQRHIERVLDKDWWRGIKDFRYRSSTEWNLGYVLEVLLAGALSGCKTLREVETLSEVYADRVPDTTLHDLMIRLNAKSLKYVLAKGVKQALRDHELDDYELPVKITAIDGKYNFNSEIPVNEHSDPIGGGGNNQMYRHLALRAMHVSSETKLYLGQHEIVSKGSEFTELLNFVDELKKLYGSTKLLDVISVDAGMVSQANAQGLVDRGLNYIMALKGTQPKLLGLVRSLFENATSDCTDEEVHKGKQTTRILTRRAVPVQEGWKHLREFWKIETIIVHPVTREISREIHYYMTSLSPETLNHVQVLRAVRSHWGIENNANWCFDVLWQEDLSPWTSRAMELVAHLRMLAYNIIERLRTRRLRTNKNRALGWKDLFRFFEHALCKLRQNLETQKEATPAFLS